MKQIFLLGVLALMSLASYAQVTTGVFGSNKTLDGVVQPHHGHTTNKWIKPPAGARLCLVPFNNQ